ncbi:MAG: NAD(P)-dependent oxidoreductase [Bacteroidetes bacterium]|nr:MAG: NAD(P)-dependent oxidoreductase [Bacteroidota bacterium]
MAINLNVMHIAVLGLGEAGSLFANGLAEKGIQVSAWDPDPRRPLHPAVHLAESNAAAAREADLIWSVNLSSAAMAVAEEVLPVLGAAKVYAEMNTTSPEKKKAICHLLKPSGAAFVDLAIMAPVPPLGILTPFWVSGPGARHFEEMLSPLGLNISYIGEDVAEASTRKLLRSIVYKGVAAVICEAVEAGEAFGLQSYIREQIRSILGGGDELTERFLEGSRIHALRRRQEMEAVAEMLEQKGVQPLVSRAAAANLAKFLPNP